MTFKYVRVSVSEIFLSLSWWISIAAVHMSASPSLAENSATHAVHDKAASSSLESFREKLVEWNKLLDQAQSVLTKSQGQVSPEEFRKLDESSQKLRMQLIASSPELTRLAEAVLLEKPADPEAFEWLDAEMSGACASGRYIEASRIGKVVSEHVEHLSVARRLNSLSGAAMSSFYVNQFELSKTQLESLQNAGPLDIGRANLLATTKQYIVRWRAEQEIRARENRSNDLPRVTLQTTNGDVVIELFKNEAPRTVSEFISMVEAHKLDNVPLKTISDGTKKALQVSADDCPLNAPKSEVSHKSRRLHFHGSVSVGKFDSSTGAKVVVSLMPVPEWDVKNAVFGRVIQGMSTLEEILHGEQGKPIGQMIRATILRE